MVSLLQMQENIATGLGQKEAIAPVVRGRAYVDAVPGCSKGNRSDEAYKLVSKLKDFGLEPDTISELLQTWNNRNDPPLNSKELEGIIDNSFKYGKSSPGCDSQSEQQKQVQEWDDIIPLEDISLPEFPLNTPSELESWTGLIKEISNSIQVPAGLPGLFSLSCISTALSGRIRVKTNESYTEPCNLYSIVLSPPGTRKSSVKKVLASPILQYQKDLRDKLKPEVERNKSEFRQLEQKRNNIEKALSKVVVDNADSLQSDLDQINKDIADFNKTTVLPQLIAGDTTIEALAANMQANNGAIAILEDEGGGFFGTVSGRYKKGEQLVNDLILKAYDCQPYYENRIGRASISMDRTAISIGLAIQPAVLQELKHRKYLEETGMLPRFIFSVPPDTVGNRTRRTVPIPESILTDYAERIKSLFICRNFTDSLTVKMSTEADEIYDRFFYYIEKRLRQGQDLYPLRAWASKLPGKVARIAGILNCYANSDRIKIDIPQIISGPVMAYAVELGHYLIEHAKAMYLLVEFSTDVQRAKKFLRFIEKTNKLVIGQQEIWQAAKNSEAGIQKIRDIEPALAVLIEHNYLRMIEPQTGKPGRPSVRFEVNPKTYDLLK